MIEKKKYQVRIRKALTEEQKIEAFGEELAAYGSATQIQTLYGKFESLADAFEKMADVPELAEYEIISVILCDSDNSDQLGEDYKWDEDQE